MSENSSDIESLSLGALNPDFDAATSKIISEKSHWLPQLNERVSEWCSSILVMETRQALKSRQFIWTYFVLLFSVGVWTLLALTIGDNGYQIGRDLLFGYWVILGFPLGLIIPFSAYRSLAREFEDGTNQLISITTMKPHQIIFGKFGSAFLQMLTYLSVLAPCICFTYLLRGISLSQISIGLMVCIGGSICLTILGLFLAGVFRSRAMGVGTSVLFVLLLGWLYYIWCVFCESAISGQGSYINFDDQDVLLGVFGIFAFFGSSAGLLLVTATSQISFPSNNRATPIRIAMFVQQTLFFAFVIGLVSTVFDADMLWIMMIFVSHYWLVMGFLMIGESLTISRRVQRTLPRSFFSRSAFSLLMPGAGRGFLFAVANVWACAIAIGLIGWFVGSRGLQGYLSGQIIAPFGGSRVFGWEECCGLLTCCLYVTWFLSVIYLVMRSFFGKSRGEWSTGIGPTISLVLGGLLISVLSICSIIVHQNLYPIDNGSNDLSIPQLLNWYWVVAEVFEGTSFEQIFVECGVVAVALLLQAVVVIGFAFAFASRELLVAPIPVPERVKIDSLKLPTSNLPEGESINEIFGELKKNES